MTAQLPRVQRLAADGLVTTDGQEGSLMLGLLHRREGCAGKASSKCRKASGESAVDDKR